MVAFLFLTSVAANGTLSHLSPSLTDRRLSPAHAAWATGLLGIANLGGTAFGTGASTAKTFSCTMDLSILTITAPHSDAGGLADVKIINITIANPATPKAPLGLMVAKSGLNAVVEWTCLDNVPDKYRVYRREENRS